MRERILERLEEKKDLPALPDIVFRLQEMIRDPRANAKSIAKIIEVDPVLAGKVLKLSNSVYYSRSTTPVKTLPVAVTKIGFNMLLKLVYSLKLMTLFTDSTLLDSTRFWRHSLAVAIFTQSLSRRIHSDRMLQDFAYMSGLMHDIGIMVFGYLVPEEYGAFLRKVPEKEEALYRQEQTAFGIDHAELGALFIEKWWHIDEHVVQAVRYHHFPFRGAETDRRCEQMVHVANGICNNQDITNGVNVHHEIFRDGAWEELGLSLSEVEEILEDVHAALEHANELMVR